MNNKEILEMILQMQKEINLKIDSLLKYENTSLEKMEDKAILPDNNTINNPMYVLEMYLSLPPELKKTAFIHVLAAYNYAKALKQK